MKHFPSADERECVINSLRRATDELMRGELNDSGCVLLVGLVRGLNAIDDDPVIIALREKAKSYILAEFDGVDDPYVMHILELLDLPLGHLH